MSFILDALKKIEEDRRRAQEGRPRESLAIGRRRSKRFGQWVVMGAIALASAVVTAAVLYLVRGPEPVSSGSVAASAGSPGSRPGGDPSVREREESVHAAAGAASELVDEGSKEAEPPSAEVDSESPGAPEPGSGRESASRTDPAPDSVPEPDPGLESAEAYVDTEIGEPEPTPPIRLVGQGSDRAPGDLPELVQVAGGPEDAARPESAPELVLQGTSVIDGHPVAVVNDQRVFEGDWVDGARVVRIEERAVELEFEGRRFRIRL